MDYVVWATLIALIWSNNEVLNKHAKDGTKPSYNYWVSVAFEFIALVGWFIVRLTK